MGHGEKRVRGRRMAEAERDGARLDKTPRGARRGTCHASHVRDASVVAATIHRTRQTRSTGTSAHAASPCRARAGSRDGAPLHGTSRSAHVRDVSAVAAAINRTRQTRSAGTSAHAASPCLARSGSRDGAPLHGTSRSAHVRDVSAVAAAINRTRQTRSTGTSAHAASPCLARAGIRNRAPLAGTSSASRRARRIAARRTDQPQTTSSIPRDVNARRIALSGARSVTRKRAASEPLIRTGVTRPNFE
ncbi:Uncharacterised protein [Burkholderia oklahomensis]|nr:hypothetical protein BG90_4985 [Burkholderia oklahomensis C6786]SUY27240.1 Uncharacterised protein [Burkholderia oklahomensis]